MCATKIKIQRLCLLKWNPSSRRNLSLRLRVFIEIPGWWDSGGGRGKDRPEVSAPNLVSLKRCHGDERSSAEPTADQMLQAGGSINLFSIVQLLKVWILPGTLTPTPNIFYMFQSLWPSWTTPTSWSSRLKRPTPGACGGGIHWTRCGLCRYSIDWTQSLTSWLLLGKLPSVCFSVRKGKMQLKHLGEKVMVTTERIKASENVE